MSKRARRHFSAEQKTAILKRLMVDKVPMSDLCEEYKLQPSVVYQWQRQMFENLHAVFETTSGPGRPPAREKQLAARVELLEAKIAKKDSVIAEISAEYVQLKKELGEP